MFDADYLAQLEAGYQSSKPKKKTGRGGTATSLISEGGALGGAMAGAAIGSAVPIVGTVIGGAIGAGLGAFGGRLAENRVRDNRWGVGDAAKEGAISGLLGAPIRAARYGIGAAGALKGGESTLAGALTRGAQAADAPGMLASALKGKVANVATGVRSDAALKNFKINDSNWISAFQKNVGEDPGAFASRLGFATSSPKEVAKNLYNPTQSVYTAYLSGVPAISKKELSTALDGKIAQYAKSAVPEQRNIGEQLAALKKDLLTRLPGSKLTALEARDLKSQFQSAVDQKLTDTAGKLNNSVNKQIADVLREAINTKAEKAGIKIDPVNLPYKGSKATTLAELGTELRGIKEFSDKAAIKQNVGRGKNPLGITPLIGGGAGAALGPVGAAGGIATSALANSQAGRKAEYALADKLAQMATKQKGTLRTGAGIGTRATLASALAGNQSSPLDPSMSANSQASSISDAPPMNANIDTQYTQTPDMSIQQSSPFDPANIEANVLNMMQQGATMKDVQAYLSMAETINSMKAAAMPKAAKPLSAESAKVVSNAQSGLQSLDAIEGMLSQDPGVLQRTALPGRGILGGVLGNAVGTSGYDNLSRNILDVITRLRTGAALTAQEEKFYRSQLPQAFDRPEVVQQKLNMFRDLFNSVNEKAGQGGGYDTNAVISALGM